MSDVASLLPTILSLLFRSAERGTLIEIVDTAAKLVGLLEPLIADLPSAQPHSHRADPAEPSGS